MSEVKRYGNTWCEVTERTVFKYDQQDGDYVKLSDYTSLQEQLTATTNSLTNAQEALKSAGIEADTVQAGVMELVSRMNDISHECGMMMGLLKDVYRYHEECAHDDMMHALIPLEYVSAINGFVERDVDGENPCPITDAYLNAVRVQGLDMLVSQKMAEAERYDSNLSREIAIAATVFANKLRVGNAGKDGSHE